MKNLLLCKKTTAILLAITIFSTTLLSSCKSSEVIMSSGVDVEYITNSAIINEQKDTQTSNGNNNDNSNNNDNNDNNKTDSQGGTSSAQQSGATALDDGNSKGDEIIISYDSNPYKPDNKDPEGISLADVNTFVINTYDQGKTVKGFFNNINLWNVHTPSKDNNYNIFEFTDYVQLMQCSGGTGGRDLFKDPFDNSVLDDYDFTRLIDACRGILDLGAKPHLKLGGVPLKFSTNYKTGGFNMNVYPPDDYNVYYNYIYALANELVKEFGRQEVLSWRFGVMTEYENKEWFMHPSGDTEETKVAFFKLYDYTVQALIDAIGEDVFVGAHSMTVTEGMWDEAEFIKHVAQGTNYATGQKGTKIDYLSASFYHEVAGAMASKNSKDFVETIGYLQESAKKYGLNNLIYGVDEGRMLTGINSGKDSLDLNTRAVGYSYQGAFDARLFRDAVLNDIDYFACWGFVYDGIPTVSYYVAKLTSQFEGMKNISVQKTTTSNREADIQAVSAYDPNTKTLRIMAYNFKNSYDYKENAKISFQIDAPVSSGSAKVTKSFVDDNCNYFDEWLKDKKTYNITDDMFSWSPDDPVISAFVNNADPQLQKIFRETLLPKYKKAAILSPKSENINVNGGKITINDTLMGNGVVFYEIQF